MRGRFPSGGMRWFRALLAAALFEHRLELVPGPECEPDAARDSPSASRETVILYDHERGRLVQRSACQRVDPATAQLDPCLEALRNNGAPEVACAVP